MVWGNKGVALHALGRIEEAVACYEEVLKINDADATACFNIAMIHHDAGRIDEATRWYRAALERDPDHAHGWASLEILGVLAPPDSDSDS